MPASSDQHERSGDVGGNDLSPERTRRLFFAFWPDNAVRATFAHATHKAVRGSGGRPVPAHNLHTTVLFLGSVVESRVSEVMAIGARAAAEMAAARLPGDHDDFAAAGFVFDRVELWKKSHVLVATTSASSGAGHLLANSLVEILRREVTRSGFTPDLKPFRAHVTVARKVSRSIYALSMRPVARSLKEFALVESRTDPDGPVYSVLQAFPLEMQPRSGS
jgi:RNA 2',3'-cyclic 3'-phosphodiesterase